MGNGDKGWGILLLSNINVYLLRGYDIRCVYVCSQLFSYSPTIHTDIGPLYINSFGASVRTGHLILLYAVGPKSRMGRPIVLYRCGRN